MRGAAEGVSWGPGGWGRDPLEGRSREGGGQPAGRGPGETGLGAVREGRTPGGLGRCSASWGAGVGGSGRTRGERGRKKEAREPSTLASAWQANHRAGSSGGKPGASVVLAVPPTGQLGVAGGPGGLLHAAAGVQRGLPFADSCAVVRLRRSDVRVGDAGRRDPCDNQPSRSEALMGLQRPAFRQITFQPKVNENHPFVE